MDNVCICSRLWFMGSLKSLGAESDAVWWQPWTSALCSHVWTQKKNTVFFREWEDGIGKHFRFVKLFHTGCIYITITYCSRSVSWNCWPWVPDVHNKSISRVLTSDDGEPGPAKSNLDWLEHIFWFSFTLKRFSLCVPWWLCDANPVREVGHLGGGLQKHTSNPNSINCIDAQRDFLCCALWHSNCCALCPGRRTQSTNLDAWATSAVPGECLASRKALVTRDSKGPECPN